MLTREITFFYLVVLMCNKVCGISKIDSRYKDVSDDIKFIVKVLHDTCKEDSGISEATIDQIRNGNFKDEIKTKKYMACVWLESTMMDELGNLNVDLMNDLCPESLKDNVANTIKCHEQVLETLPIEDRIFEMEKCLYEIDPENFIMI